MINKKTIINISIVFTSLLVISLFLSWLLNRPKSIDLDSEPTDVMLKPDVKPLIQKPPPPPNVYWSEFNRSLLSLEQEHMEILQTITPINTQPVIRKPITIQKTAKVLVKYINWSDIGENLLELEQKNLGVW